MNTISKIHKRFSEYLNNPRVLTNPEEFLGPNYEEVLKFWIILEELSKEQLRVVKERDDAFFNENRSEWRKAEDLAYEASEEVVGEDNVNNAGWAALDVTKYSDSIRVTRELIGMQLILDQENPLTFINFFLNLL